MKFWKKGLLTVLMILLAVSVFAGGKPQAPAASSGPTEVVFYSWSYDLIVNPLLEAFNKQFEGKYKLSHVRIANAETLTINTALASGEKIDVMQQSNAFDLRQRADAGIYTGIKKFLDRDGLDYATIFGASTEQVQNFNGDYYSMPYAKGLATVYFNKKMFDEAGEPYPDPNWTWDDFRATARRMTKGSGVNKVYGAQISASTTQLYWALIAQQRLGVNYYYNTDLKSTRFDHPAMKESLQFFYDLFFVDQSVMPLEEYVARKIDSVEGNNIKGLVDEQYAMLFIPAFGCLYLHKDYYGTDLPAGTDIGMANLPRPVGSNGPVTVVYNSTLSIPAATQDPDAAWTLLKFICVDRADLWAGVRAMFPGYDYKTVEEANEFNDIIFRNKPGFDYDGAMELMALPRGIVNRDNTVVQGQARINDLLLANLSLVFSGDMSVDAALADLKTKGDRYITEDLAK